MDIGVQEIRQWHLQRGWADIGYAYVIRRNGSIEKGRDLNRDGNVEDDIGAHALHHNANSIGICLVGGMAEDGSADSNFTYSQLVSLHNLLSNLYVKYNYPKIMGHRDVSSKACPCFDIQSFMSR
jgi:N-acetyl-anhydromuramyl-L-alanine amidase AmpD